jgi:hypothetical protein
VVFFLTRVQAAFLTEVRRVKYVRQSSTIRVRCSGALYFFHGDRLRWSNSASNPVPSGAAHMIPTSAVEAGK